MDRLARSTIDLQQIVDEFVAKGARVEFVHEGQSYSRDENDPSGRLMLQILGAFAEFERNLIRQRQAEGIRLARAAGKYRGRSKSLSPEQVASAAQQIGAGVPKARVAREFGVDRSTLYRALRDGTARVSSR